MFRFLFYHHEHQTKVINKENLSARVSQIYVGCIIYLWGSFFGIKAFSMQAHLWKFILKYANSDLIPSGLKYRLKNCPFRTCENHVRQIYVFRKNKRLESEYKSARSRYIWQFKCKFLHHEFTVYFKCASMGSFHRDWAHCRRQLFMSLSLHGQF